MQNVLNGFFGGPKRIGGNISAMEREETSFWVFLQNRFCFGSEFLYVDLKAFSPFQRVGFE